MLRVYSVLPDFPLVRSLELDQGRLHEVVHVSGAPDLGVPGVWLAVDADLVLLAVRLYPSDVLDEVPRAVLLAFIEQIIEYLIGQLRGLQVYPFHSRILGIVDVPENG